MESEAGRRACDHERAATREGDNVGLKPHARRERVTNEYDYQDGHPNQEVGPIRYHARRLGE
jgi:hypothetical protein